MIAISADGVPVAYTVLGTGSPLVLLHGFSETGESWREAGYVDRFLSNGRRVVLIDCRGHGASGKPHDAAAYSGDKRARDVLAVLDALGIHAVIRSRAEAAPSRPHNGEYVICQESPLVRVVPPARQIYHRFRVRVASSRRRCRGMRGDDAVLY